MHLIKTKVKMPCHAQIKNVLRRGGDGMVTKHYFVYLGWGGVSYQGGFTNTPSSDPSSKSVHARIECKMC